MTEHDAYYQAGETIQRDKASDPHGEIYTTADGEAYERHLKKQPNKLKPRLGPFMCSGQTLHDQILDEGYQIYNQERVEKDKGTL